MGGTGNIRTLRNQSGSNGSRTLGSILAGGNSGGAGSVRRMYAYFKKVNPNEPPFTSMFGINRGQFRNRTDWYV